jgi:hypothetical protein
MNFLQGLSRPARLAGVVLIGIGLVAGVIGVVTATGGDTAQNATPSTSASAAPAPGPGSAPPPAPPAPSVSTSSAAPAPPPPGTTPPPAQPPAGPKPGQTDAKWVPVRVYNNGTIQGLAARAANEFRADGWNITEVSAYPYGIIPTTTAYYTPGTDEETAAKALAATFGMRAEERFEGIKNSTPGVIVILTNDYRTAHGKDG